MGMLMSNRRKRATADVPQRGPHTDPNPTPAKRVKDASGELAPDETKPVQEVQSAMSDSTNSMVPHTTKPVSEPVIEQMDAKQEQPPAEVVVEDLKSPEQWQQHGKKHKRH